ncbi:hypothetical protein CLOSTMETH_01053 [[Clostridium] methylpentosum DSM 5476]|uniref:Uncharacterized protein n=1 Tax=[Clostridium] methylpentosum DSM 5476 TaxID=537013 RepID=C0EB36_9FIRM|nr:hypothetical protein CLOSTMETH_01053 [[Clostridium] methylpentosum DSM 5476]
MISTQNKLKYPTIFSQSHKIFLLRLTTQFSSRIIRATAEQAR